MLKLRVVHASPTAALPGHGDILRLLGGQVEDKTVLLETTWAFRDWTK